MPELIDRRAGERYGPEVSHLATYGSGVEGHTDGVLHPSIGNKNPNGRDGRTDDGQPGRG